MWWSRVSTCALSLTCVLGALGCGGSGFSGQGSSDSLTMSFQAFSGEGITQQDSVFNTSASVDVCQDICAIGGALVDVQFEAFTETVANALFINNGFADILIDRYTVSIPGTGIPPRTVQTAVLLPGGRCVSEPTRHCGLDNDCRLNDTCDHVEVPVQVLLYDFTTKELIRGDQRCPELDPENLVVIPGNVTPQTAQTNVTFSGSDESGERFTVKTGLVGSFFDANNCGMT